MKIKLTLVAALLLVLGINLFGQHKYFSLGVNDNGICLGNSSKYNGLRLNIWDKDFLKINGINISCISEGKKLNGISIDLLVTDIANSNGIIMSGCVIDGNSNGLAVSGCVTDGNHNGLTVSGLYTNYNKLNGMGISCFILGDTLNGLLIGLFAGCSAFGANAIPSGAFINGIAVAGGQVTTGTLNGGAISLIGNHTNTQNGVAIGLINSTYYLHGFIDRMLVSSIRGFLSQKTIELLQ